MLNIKIDSLIIVILIIIITVVRVEQRRHSTPEPTCYRKAVIQQAGSYFNIYAIDLFQTFPPT